MDNLVLLVGNPNVGKSTLFNTLTGMKQHTGNWTGKTVEIAINKCIDKNFYLCDLPGTYSLISTSEEESITEKYINKKNYNAVIIVCDATCLERNLILVLQILQITNKVIVCVNLIDEAEKKGIEINIKLLSYLLGVPTVAVSARKKTGINELLLAVDRLKTTEYNPLKIEYDEKIEFALEKIVANSKWEKLQILSKKDNKFNKSLQKYGIDIVTNSATELVKMSENIAKKVTKLQNMKYKDKDLKIDKIVTSKLYGIPLMFMLLCLVFWITIVVANYPSDLLFNLFNNLESKIIKFLQLIFVPNFIIEPLIFGVYRVLTWVISVMLPPMAIFFPLFTLLEDLGYLPRIAFNLDKCFKRCNTNGKQSLTMCMGFGCNAVGVTGTRIINSKRERLIAILTNSLVPCNGRFPTLISIIIMFIFSSTLFSTLTLATLILISILVTFCTSFILSKTVLKGMPSSFTLELPPYRKPEIKKVIISSLFTRTLVVLGRAIIIAAPAGLIIWLLANNDINGISILKHISNFLDPFAQTMGLDGVILMAFILGIPANEIVIPLMLMGYMSLGHILDMENLTELKALLINNDWTIKTAICTLIFTMFHFPCSTTLITIKKETDSWYWTILSFLIPLFIGVIICFLINLIM